MWADKAWQQVGETYGAVTSPVTDKDGNVFFADAKASRIYKSDAQGKVSVFKQNSGGANALSVGADGRLYAAVRGRLVSWSASGDEKTVASNVNASGLAVAANGGVYFSDAVHKTVGYVDPRGKARTVIPEGEIGMPSGIAISPDQAMVVVTDALGRHSWSYQIAADGSLINGEPSTAWNCRKRDG